MRVLATTKEKVKLDLTDRKILYLLSINSRFSYSTLAKHVNLSREAVKQRINRLTEKEVLLGFHALIDFSRLGRSSYHVFVRLNNPQKKIEEQFIKDILADSDANALLEYEGRFDFEISYLLGDIKDFDQKLKLLSSKEIKDSSFFVLLEPLVSKTYPKCFQDFEIALKSVRHDGSFFNEFAKQKDQSVNLDDTDNKLLGILSDKARISMTELASKLGLSVDSAIYRIKKLIKAKIIMGFRPIINYAALGYSVYCLFFRLKNLTPEKEKKFSYFLKIHDNILWSANCLGTANNISYFIVKDTLEYHDVVNEIREKFSDILDSYESLLGFAEYKYTFFPQKK